MGLFKSFDVLFYQSFRRSSRELRVLAAVLPFELKFIFSFRSEDSIPNAESLFCFRSEWCVFFNFLTRFWKCIAKMSIKTNLNQFVNCHELTLPCLRMRIWWVKDIDCETRGGSKKELIWELFIFIYIYFFFFSLFMGRYVE